MKRVADSVGNHETLIKHVKIYEISGLMSEEFPVIETYNLQQITS